MGDDIDDLLDEVERKYCSKPPPNATNPPKKASSLSSSKYASSKPTGISFLFFLFLPTTRDSALLSEIDDLINDAGTHVSQAAVFFSFFSCCSLLMHQAGSVKIT